MITRNHGVAQTTSESQINRKVEEIMTATMINQLVNIKDLHDSAS
jgi:hypothetical protein